ncbi:hypothetical protein B5V03_18660 [Bradyrhizobium betae]|uniref:Uncharacterized protein n=1 Tax=Bradyrhizobium betae TaxID=244734 RepID=A0A4Q1V588_9BRAD|nr:hypothetical protein B5V03_18660 [Bradyrhizobium betae]
MMPQRATHREAPAIRVVPVPPSNQMRRERSGIEPIHAAECVRSHGKSHMHGDGPPNRHGLGARAIDDC